MVKIIESRQNNEIKKISELKYTSGRRKQGLFLAEGARTIETLINTGLTLNTLYVTEKMAAQGNKLTTDDRITLVSEPVIEKISTSTTNPGMVGVFKIPEQPDINSLSSGIVIARLADPGNVGTLIRTCAAMGHKTVVMIESVDPWSPKVIQASAGTIGMVKIFSLPWPTLVAHKKGLSLVAMIVSGGSSPELLKNKDCLLVIGNEAHGLDEAWTSDCDLKVTLDMPGNIESLNAAVAGSIALYFMK